ncbi:MAG TPA: glycosyltransferase family 39 protein [Candidatus Eisenbacteria bacterium]|nr:glycosyltransferase family 39 protein [Candidatus Eisenbacteria bacterium]
MPVRALLLIGAVALALRLLYLADAADSPLQRNLELDPALHDAHAWSLAQGQDPDRGQPYFRAPLYTHALAWVYATFGHSPGAARVVQAGAGAITAVLLGLVAWHLAGRRAALLAALLGALYGPLIFFTGELLSVTLEVALAAASLLFTLRASGGKHGSRDGALAGIFLSLGAITRPTVLPFALVTLAWLVGRRAERRVWVAYTVAVLSLPVLVTIRNAVAGGDRVFIASQGGINFHIGNHPSGDGTTAYVPGIGSGLTSTHEAPARVASEEAGRALRPSEVSAHWFGKGLAFWRERPGDALALYARKVGLVWNRRELPNTLDQEFFGPFQSWLFRLPLLPGFPLVAPIALAAAWSERRRAWLLLGFLAVTTLVVAAFFVCDRFRLPLVVALIPLAAVGLDRAIEHVRGAGSVLRAARARPATLLVAAVAAALVWLPFPRLQATETGMSQYRLARAYEKDGNAQAATEAYLAADKAGFDTPEFLNAYGVFRLQHGDPFGAEALFVRALVQERANGPTHANLAETYMHLERWEQAAQSYENAAELMPGQAPELYVNAGTLYAGVGRPDRAARMFRAALEARPGFGPALEGLSRLGVATGP